MHNYSKFSKLNVVIYGGDKLKKRAGAIALILTIAFTFSSCFFNDKKQEETTPTQTTIAKTDINDYTDKYTAVNLSFGYDGLNTDIQRQCYNEIAKNSSNITSKKSQSGFYLSNPINLSADIKEEDIFIALTAYKYDNPGDFWLEETFLTTSYSDKVVLELCSYYSSKEIIDNTKTFDNKVTEILNSMPHNLSEFERELYFHDYLIENCSYDDTAAETIDNSQKEHYHSAFTSYGALVEGKAVCQGYTNALSYLLSCVGIENTSISGKSQNANHIWNAVKIEGNWYYIDATWDDNAYEDAGEAYKYDYFNLTTLQLESDHIIGKTFEEMTVDEITGGENGLGHNFNIYVPECTSNEYNYYVQKGAVLTGFTSDDDYQMGQELLEVAQNGEEYYHIYVDEDYLDFAYASEHLFDPYVYNYQYYVNIANESLGNCQLDYSASIVKKENLNVITVKLTYI